MEKRTLIANIQARDAQDIGGDAPKKCIVEGYASTFNERYTLMRGTGWEWQETIDSRAFDNCLMSDVVFQYNHAGRVLARTTNGTLQLRTDEHGLHVEADLSGTEDGRSLYDEIRNGYVNKMSLSFTIKTKSESEERTNGASGGAVYLDTITAIERVYDVSAVSFPANEGTDIAARNADLAARQKRAKTREAEDVASIQFLSKGAAQEGGKNHSATETTANVERARMAARLSLSLSLSSGR